MSWAPSAGAAVITASTVGLAAASQTETINTNRYTWIGGVACDERWNSDPCWQGEVPPGKGDTPHFDSVCLTSCSPTVDVDIDLAGINMHLGLRRHDHQGSATILIETGGFTQGAGQLPRWHGAQ